MSSLDGLKSSFYKFREKKYALPVALLLTFAISALLLQYSSILCFGYLAIAILAYYVPWFMGMRDRKKLAIYGVGFFVALAVVFTALTATSIMDTQQSPVSSDDDTTMFDGKVTPFNDAGATSYNFTIIVNDPTINEVRVIVTDQVHTTAAPLNESTTDYVQLDIGGRQFYKEIQLDEPSVYAYQFQGTNGTAWIETNEGVGPIAITSGPLFVQMVGLNIIAVMMSIGVLFYLLLLMAWFTERSRKRAQEMQRNMGPPPAGDMKASEEKFVCSECGATVPADAKVCPQCGERFDDEEPAPVAAAKEEEYYCTDCGATVKESDTVCPSCGKKFED